ncbi:MAG: hypothetical protein GY810_16275 [Aureispira sp.]|nr:hypothetical protein [Aureispira sp.]
MGVFHKREIILQLMPKNILDNLRGLETERLLFTDLNWKKPIKHFLFRILGLSILLGILFSLLKYGEERGISQFFMMGAWGIPAIYGFMIVFSLDSKKRDMEGIASIPGLYLLLPLVVLGCCDVSGCYPFESWLVLQGLSKMNAISFSIFLDSLVLCEILAILWSLITMFKERKQLKTIVNDKNKEKK